MKYRVVQLIDGRFKCQYRTLFFWWEDSCHGASSDFDAQKQLAIDAQALHAKPKVVWPTPKEPDHE